ncbi:protein kinase [Chryseobacterium sp. JJR-5R]|uniref:protein kinase domain-containing protein n=1 Tax=Chryseobacterium sp. JJR-5R TaxID=3093923 RepID=UPI002A75A124|nr:protein kinase [Chryseobacterium sp. JJR-5R]WPO84109.1 protein kinase [Chryseobacterium sp. JJR-5R]
MMNFFELEQKEKIKLLEGFESDAKCIDINEGMCGEIFVFDHGSNTFPRYSCIKVPKSFENIPNEEIGKRFVREMYLQLSFYHNKFVHWPSDFDIVLNTPIVSFRYWGNDLAKLIRTTEVSILTKLSILVYTCVGLRHCYKKGLVSHQDIKPSNIFIQNVREQFTDLPDLDIYNLAIVADFGLANAFTDINLHDGSRPYMAPEQWNKTDLSSATDIFAIGVIFFELLTNGYHPVGIKLHDWWPKPQTRNSKKWTGSKYWIKWIANDCKIQFENYSENKNYISFIEKMLLINPAERPTIDEVIDFLLEQIKVISDDSHSQLNFLINYFEEQSSKIVDVETNWHPLFEKWQIFKRKFE